MRNIGIIVFLLGVLGLVVPSLLHVESNVTLLVSAIVMFIGIVLYVILTKIEVDKR